MAVQWINHVVIAAPRNGTTSHTVSPSSGAVVSGSLFTPTAGNLLIVALNGAVTSSTPSGWTLPSGGSIVANSGSYLWYRTAAGGDSLTTTHNGSNYAVVFEFWEFPAGSSFLSAASSSVGSGSTGAGANATLSSIGATHTLLMAMAGMINAAATNPTVNTTTSGTPTPTLLSQATSVGNDGSTDGYGYASAYADDTTATTWTPTLTMSNNLSPATKETITWAIRVPYISNTFEGGTSGTSISTSNSGGTSGTAVSGVTVNATTVTFSNAQSMHGTESMLINYAGNGSAGYAIWNFTPTTTTTRVAVRTYVYFPAGSTLTSQQLIMFYTTTPGFISRISTDSTGRLILNDTSGATPTGGAMSGSLTTGQWYRIELGITVGTTSSNGAIDFAYFLGDSSTAVQSISLTGLNFGTSSIGMIRLGTAGLVSSGRTIHYDDFAARELTSGFIGPSGTPSGAPVAILRSSSTANTASPGSVDASTNPGPLSIAAPAGLAAGDLYVLLQWVAQGTGSSGSYTNWYPEAGFTFVNSGKTGDSTTRWLGIYASVVTDPSAYATVTPRAAASGTRLAYVALAFKPTTGYHFSLSNVTVSNLTYSSTASTTATTPAVIGDLIVGIFGSNKSSSSTQSSHSATGGTLYAQAVATNGTTLPYADSVVSAVTGGLGVTANVSQANWTSYSLGITQVSGGGNVAPVAAFTHSEANLTTSVNASTSTDSDGTIAAYDWNWGDSTLHDSGVTATHAYRDAGTYTITLTVTDNSGGTGQATQTVTVARPPMMLLGSTSASRVKVGTHEVVAVYKGSTKIKQVSHTIAEQFADTNVFVAHRGFSATFPEMTMYAYDQAFAWGMKAIEVSVQVSSQGTFWCGHDPTVDRVTGGAYSGNYSSFTDAQLAAMYVKGSTASENPTQADQPFLKLTDLLAKYGDRVVMFIEDKTYSHQAALVSLLQSYSPDVSARYIWKIYAGASIHPSVVAAGMSTWCYYFDSDMPNFNSTQANYTYVGVDYNSSDATLTAAVSTAGASRVIGHIIPNTTQGNRMLGFGMKGLMCASRIVAPPNQVL